MKEQIEKQYKGWSITVKMEHNMCSKYSFDLIDPDGRSSHVSMGGDNVDRALERAKEMVDMEKEMEQ